MDPATITDVQSLMETDSFDLTVSVSVKKKNYNKQVPCKHCGRWMRDDNMKRHMKIHADLTNAKDEDEIHEEIKKRKLGENETVKDEKIAKIKKKDASCYEQSPSKSSIPSDIEEEILQYYTIYQEKIEKR